MIQKTCVVCGDPFEARRADAQTCSVRCRASKSRRNRDSEIGSPERREKQREGLDKKYVYRQQGQARAALTRAGLMPNVSEDDPSPLWHVSDGWWHSEPRTIGPSVVEIREAVYIESACRYLLGIREAGAPDKAEQTRIFRASVDPVLQRRLTAAWSMPARIGLADHEVLEMFVGRYAELMHIDRGSYAAGVKACGPWATNSRRWGVIEDTEGKEDMIATDERLALDAERLSLVARKLASECATIAAIAERLRERFPKDSEVQGAIDRLLEQIQNA